MSERGVGVLDQLQPLAVALQVEAGHQSIAEGNEDIAADISPGNIDRPAGVSRLYEFYLDQQDRFNRSYNKILDGHFTVKVKGQDEFTVQPIDSTEKVLGVIRTSVSPIRVTRGVPWLVDRLSRQTSAPVFVSRATRSVKWMITLSPTSTGEPE